MKRILSFALVLAGIVGTSWTVSAEPAAAAPSCDRGAVCLWTGHGGSGKKYTYFNSANHSHAIRSVHFNYQTYNTRFMTAANGRGVEITRYYTSQRGFRNWSESNAHRCKSHWDFR